MAPGLPARRWVIVCVVLAAIPARADKREVAVIDLSEDKAAQQLTEAIYDELTRHADLRPLKKRQLDSALVGPLLDEDGRAIERARGYRTAAEDALSQFNYAEAKNQAIAGEEALTQVTPTPEAISLYADLVLARGIAAFHGRDTNAANRAFELVHRLDPVRRLDPARVIPELVSAFELATTTTPPKTQLALKGTGRVWIDGVERGTAPGTFDVAYGYHLVQLTGADRETRGKLVVVPDTPVIAVEDATASEELRVKRTRLQLARAPDAVARAGAMQQLAALLGVGDAVLISKSEDGKLRVQTWRDRAPGFSALREHADEPAIDLLEPLAPPRPIEPPKLPPIALPPLVHREVEPVWYRRRWVQASVAGGVIVTVVGAILWARREKMISWDNDIKPGM